MARYDNLKDYFQGKHLELIKGAIRKHLEGEFDCDYQINTTLVKSLVCTNDDVQFNVEYELGISTGITIDNITDSRSFILTIRGNLEKKLNDIQVAGVKDISESDFPSDNLLSQFILPDIPIGEEERIANEFFDLYKFHGIFEGCSIPIKKLIKEKRVLFSKLPDNCLGQIILVEKDEEVNYNDETGHICSTTCHVYPGNILLNTQKYFIELDGGLLITVAHELVHWVLHQRFFKVLMLLGEDHVDLNLISDNYNVTDMQKALNIAETQAAELAIRVAIPKNTVEETINRISKDLSIYYENKGDRVQAFINKFANEYHVSPLVAKERLRHLGYDWVDGTCLCIYGNTYQSFIFNPGTLSQNETFVINRTNFEKLLREDKEFAGLIESHYYIYNGCVVCLNDIRYIKFTYMNGRVCYKLTDYAREHADECCLKFTYHIQESEMNNLNYPINNSLFRLYTTEEYGTEDNDGHYTLSDAAMEDRKAYELKKQQILNIQKVLAEMAFNGIKTFQETLKYHLEKRNLKPSDICDEDRLKKDTLDSYLADESDKGHRNPPLEKIMVICNFLQLEYELSIDLLSKAGVKLVEGKKKDDIYDYLLTITNAPISAWDTILTEEGLKPIGKNKK